LNILSYCLIRIVDVLWAKMVSMYYINESTGALCGWLSQCQLPNIYTIILIGDYLCGLKLKRI